MRIAYLTPQYPKPSHTFIRLEIRELEARGYEVLRLSIRPPEAELVDESDLDEARRTIVCLEQPPLAFARALAVCALRPGRVWDALRATWAMARASERGLLRHLAYLIEAALVLALLRRHRASHVHVHFGTNAAAVARLVRRLGGPTFSLTIHGPDEFDAAIGLSLGAKLDEAAFAVAVSDFTSAQLLRWAPEPARSRIHVVRCSVGERFFASAGPIPPDSTSLVYVGRLAPQKGLLLLVDAFADLVDGGIDARLVFAGGGELRGTLERRIAARGLGGRVEITGWIDAARVQRELAAARCLVLPSFAEGLPVVLMEALAMGRPAISTFVAGIPELLEPGRNGWLVPAGNRERLREAMSEACRLPVSRLEEMGRAGSVAVRARHDLRTEIEKLDRLFRQHASASAGG